MNRRSFVGRLFACLGALVGLGTTAKATTGRSWNSSKMLILPDATSSGYDILPKKRARVTMLAPKVDRLKLLLPNELVPGVKCDKASYVFDLNGDCQVFWHGTTVWRDAAVNKMAEARQELMVPYVLELKGTRYQACPKLYQISTWLDEHAVLHYNLVYNVFLQKL